MSTSALGLLSPTPSTISLQSSNAPMSLLPPCRTQPIKPDSQKETWLINRLDSRLLRITRRYAKKFSSDANDTSDAKGYVSFHQVVRDLEPIFNLVWASATPTLQIPYLLTLAGLFCSYLPTFPFLADQAMFRFAKKLDEGFSSLLSVQTGAGFHVSMTYRVRIKSLVEQTRVVAIGVASRNACTNPMDSEDDSDDDEEDDIPDRVMMGVSTIYQRTMELLGNSLV